MLFEYVNNQDIKAVKEYLHYHPEALNERDNDGNTALHFASKIGHLPLVKVLLASGFDPTTKNDNQQTAVDVANSNNNTHIATYIREQAATMIQRRYRERKYIKPARDRVLRIFKSEPIPIVSKKNSDKLKSNLKEMPLLPDNQREALKQQFNISSFLTDTEVKLVKQLLRMNWKLKNVMSLSLYTNFKGNVVIRSIKNRQNKGEYITLKMERENLGTHDHIYFSIGIGDRFYTPLDMLGNKSDKYVSVEIDLNEALEQQPFLLKGMWGSETFANYSSDMIPRTLVFGDTTYTAKYSGYSKYYVFQRNDGTEIAYNIKIGDEICEGNDLQLQLCYKFIDWLRCIGGDYYDYIMENFDNTDVLESAFNARFSAYEFEVLKPSHVNLGGDKTFVTKKDLNIKRSEIPSLYESNYYDYLLHMLNVEQSNIGTVLSQIFTTGIPVKEDSQIKILLNQHQRIYGKSSLHHACLFKNVHAVRFFLENGCYANEGVYLQTERMSHKEQAYFILFDLVAMTNPLNIELLTTLRTHGAKLSNNSLIILLIRALKDKNILSIIGVAETDNNVTKEYLQKAIDNPDSVPMLLEEIIGNIPKISNSNFNCEVEYLIDYTINNQAYSFAILLEDRFERNARRYHNIPREFREPVPVLSSKPVADNKLEVRQTSYPPSPQLFSSSENRDGNKISKITISQILSEYKNTSKQSIVTEESQNRPRLDPNLKAGFLLRHDFAKGLIELATEYALADRNELQELFNILVMDLKLSFFKDGDTQPANSHLMLDVQNKIITQLLSFYALTLNMTTQQLSNWFGRYNETVSHITTNNISLAQQKMAELTMGIENDISKRFTSKYKK